jgi:hypothetical protein
MAVANLTSPEKSLAMQYLTSPDQPQHALKFSLPLPLNLVQPLTL